MENNEIEIKIEYEDRFVAFLDVLGFKDMVIKKDNKKISKYLTQVQFMVSSFREILKKEGISVELDYIVISDSVIISTLKTNNNNTNLYILKILCTTISTLQAHLCNYDIWLRGAISSGETYFRENQVIGKAYIDAYLLEEQLVSNPQVILDNKIIKELGFTNAKDFIDKINDKSNPEIIRNILYDWNNKNYIVKDFPLFISYFEFFFDNSENTLRWNKLYMVNTIVSSIENKICSDINLYTKYKWVVNYALSLIDKYNNPKYNKFKERLEKL